MNHPHTLSLLGVSAFFFSVQAAAALTIQSAYLPGADLAFFGDNTAISASPFFADIKKLAEKETKEKEGGGESEATKRINEALVGFFGPNGAGATKVIEDDPLSQLGLEAKDIVAVAGSLKGLDLLFNDGIPDVAVAVQFGKKLEQAKLVEVVKKQLKANYPAAVLKETMLGANKVHVIAFGDKPEDDLHFFVTDNLPKTLLLVGTKGGLTKALANEAGTLPENLKTTLTLHGKPQMWVSLVIPESQKAQLAASTAEDPLGPGSSALGSARSLALSCNFTADISTKLTVDFAKPEGPAFLKQLTAPQEGAAPEWAQKINVSVTGQTAVITNKTTMKEVEGLVGQATAGETQPPQQK